MQIKKILIVEDNKSHITILKRIFEILRIPDVTGAKDGEEAWTLMKNKAPIFDLVVSDQNMPNMNGLELLDEIRHDRLLYKTPFILITAQSSGAGAVSAKQHKADYYLPKPFKVNELEMCLEEIRSRDIA